MVRNRTLWAIALVALVASSPTVVRAETITTTDGIFTVIESLANLGAGLSYVSGGDGLIGFADSWPTMADTPANRAFAAGAADHTWLQFDPAIVWSAGSPMSQVFAVPGVDHAPNPQENLEFIVWGSSSPSGVWEEGKIVAIYRDGFDTANTIAGHSDDYTSLWQFSQAYSFFRVTSGDHLVPPFGSTGEGEIDALVAVPEPSTLLLLGTGLLSIGRTYRRKK